MGLFSWLKRKVKRQKKQRKPTVVPVKKSETEDDDDKMDDDVVVLYPLYDPRVIRSEGTEPPLLEQRERVLSLSKQMTGIHTELRSGEIVDVPHSDSEGLSEPMQEERESEDSEFIPLRPLQGDSSPLSVGSMEPFSTPTKSLSRPSSFQLPPPVKTPPKIPTREPTPEPKEPPPPPPPEPEPPAPQPEEEPPTPPPAHAPPQKPAPLPPPPHLKPPSPSSSKKNSPSTASSETSAEGSEQAPDIENLPTAPTTPRGVRTLEYTKQPRMMLLQPYVKPHPATIRMQREGRRHILRCKQLQAAIDLYAARGSLDIFRVGPHDTDECNSCRFTDFTDTPLLW